MNTVRQRMTDGFTIFHTCIRRGALWRLMFGVLALALVAGGSMAPTAHAAPNVTVRLFIERLRAIDCPDGNVFGCNNADFYAFVWIDGEKFETPTAEDQNETSPNWELSKSIDIAKGSVPIQINLYDDDDTFRGGDDQMDIDPNPGSDLNVMVRLKPCSIAGDVSGGCGTSLLARGFEDDPTEIQFRVEVELPPSAPGLHVACNHDPIWPQATDLVTFTATALDGELDDKIVDSVELFVNDAGVPADARIGLSKASATRGPFPNGSTIFYACRIRDGDTELWSGWQQVYVGTPSQGRAVPVLYTGPRSSRIDVVFIADRDDYTGPADPNFIADVGAVVQNGYFNEDVFLRNRDKFNFWIALDTGDADGTPSTKCSQLDPPGNWDEGYTFADTGAIVHTNPFRDCAKRGLRVFSSEPTSLGTFLHETGHSPFGLADEYCCDGGYFQNEPYPDVYDELAACQADPLATAPDSCQEIADPSNQTGWFRLDSAATVSNDLMTNNRTPQPADIRRIEWLLDMCRSAKC